MVKLEKSCVWLLVIFFVLTTFSVTPIFADELIIDCKQENAFDYGENCNWTGHGRCCCWCPDPTGGHYWGHIMDFGTILNDRDVYFEIRPGAGDLNCTTTGYMYYSTDGNAWTLFWSQSGLAGWTTYQDTVHISNNFRFIRANTDGCSVDWSLAKVEYICPEDNDCDGILNDNDNCPDIYNPDQYDYDGDTIGDACDVCTDTDGDGYGDPGFPINTCDEDNCPDDYNAGQEDYDNDGTGDVCDVCTDTDGDGYGNPGYPHNTCDEDNCPDDYNLGQEDFDGDGVGDACDVCTDLDGDGFGDPGFPHNTCDEDNCPNDYNPGQEDFDGDGIGDACDDDYDGDGVPEDGGDHFCTTGETEDCDDNCPVTANGPNIGTCTAGTNAGDPCTIPGENESECGTAGFCSMDQEDTDEDEVGDACVDDDGDGITDFFDNCPEIPNALDGGTCSKGASAGDPCTIPGTNESECGTAGFCSMDQEDADLDGVGDVCDECTDTDGDEYGDPEFFPNTCDEDNCSNAYNPGQEDTYPPCDNSIGDACECEADFDCDKSVYASDLMVFTYNYGRTDCTNGSPCDGDFNCDGNVDGYDFMVLYEDYGRTDCPPCHAGPYCDYSDIDCDGYSTGEDNCPAIYNPTQQNSDSDSHGDVCDNCPTTDNENQADYDGDGTGDVCDECTDLDGDGYGDPGFPYNTCDEDNCPLDSNPGQADNDADGAGNVCDNCSQIPNGPNLGVCAETCDVFRYSLKPCTSDGDCPDECWSCMMNQEDNYPAGGNGVGDVCEWCYAEFDGDGNVYPSDLSVFLGEYGRTDCNINPPPCQSDFDGDGNVYPSDLSVFLDEYGRTDCPVMP